MVLAFCILCFHFEYSCLRLILIFCLIFLFIIINSSMAAQTFCLLQFHHLLWMNHYAKTPLFHRFPFVVIFSIQAVACNSQNDTFPHAIEYKIIIQYLFKNYLLLNLTKNCTDRHPRVYKQIVDLFTNRLIFELDHLTCLLPDRFGHKLNSFWRQVNIDLRKAKAHSFKQIHVRGRCLCRALEDGSLCVTFGELSLLLHNCFWFAFDFLFILLILFFLQLFNLLQNQILHT